MADSSPVLGKWHVTGFEGPEASKAMPISKASLFFERPYLRRVIAYAFFGSATSTW